MPETVTDLTPHFAAVASAIRASRRRAKHDPATRGSQLGVSIPGTRLAFESQAQLDVDMDLVRGLGVSWIRFDVSATQIEVTQGSRDWSNIDRIVGAAEQRGLRVLGILTTIPAWAGASWQTGADTQARRDAFVAFAQAAADRYKGRVDAWEVWNEPNSATFWVSPSVANYGALLRAAYTAIKTADPAATVISGGTAGGQSGALETAAWYGALYQAGDMAYADAANTHPYTNLDGPLSGEMAATKTVKLSMEAAGQGRKPLWGTEFGAPSAGPSSVSEATQATLITDVAHEWWKSPNAGPLFAFTLWDSQPPSDTTDREDHFGLFRTDGTRKPAATAVEALAKEVAAPVPQVALAGGDRPTSDPSIPVLWIGNPGAKALANDWATSSASGGSGSPTITAASDVALSAGV